VAALQDGEHTFANTVKALANDELISDTLAANCYFPSYVSTDKATRYTNSLARVRRAEGNARWSDADDLSPSWLQGCEY
jgi:hypothetical protein